MEELRKKCHTDDDSSFFVRLFLLSFAHRRVFQHFG